MKTYLIGFLALLLTSLSYALPAPDGNSVLVLKSSVFGSPGSPEETKAAAQGFTVVSVGPAQWAVMSTAEFNTYRFLTIGDPDCSTSTTTTIAAAEGNTAIWGPAVNGPVIIIGTDPTWHFRRGNVGAGKLIDGGIAFAGSDAARTGAYIALSCYYHFSGALTPVPLLDAFEVGGFTVIGGAFIGGLNNAHIVATHPALTGLTDGDLSNWFNSVHAGFDSWPIGFEVLAIARDGTVATYTAPDGTVGVPYILARGVTVISNIDLSPDTATNPVGTTHTVVAEVLEDGVPIVGTEVRFTVISGPSTGTTGSSFTDSNGLAYFSWSSATAGTDVIEATYVTSGGVTQRSDRVEKIWSGVVPIVCDAGPDDSVNENTAYQLDGTGSSGGSGALSYFWSGPEALDDPLSATPTFLAPVVSGNQDLQWTLEVSDTAGQVETCEVVITVIDSDLPPDCSNATASEQILWPPNHKLHEIEVTGVVDTENGSTITIIGVTQDEPTNGLGDGDLSPDASIDGETVRVRAERSGLGDGRVYEIHFTATDNLGQSCSGSVEVGVPHDKKDLPIDSGQSFDSTVE